jgi:hypothetical protein
MPPNPQRKLPLHATRPAESSEPQVEPWQESPARKRPFNSAMRTAGVGVQALRTGTPDVVEKGANGIGRSARSASRISDLDHSSAHPALADYSLSEICADVPDISLNNAPEAPQR